MRTHLFWCVRISLLPCCRGLALCNLLLLLPRRKLPLALFVLEIRPYHREQAPGQGLQFMAGYPALVRSHALRRTVALYDFLFQRCAHAWALFDIRGLHFRVCVSSSLFPSCGSSFCLFSKVHPAGGDSVPLACPFSLAREIC